MIPAAVSAYTADDFTVNSQPTYAVAPGTSKLLILDLTLPEPIGSIKIQNEGTVQQYNVTRLQIYRDGSSPGWDGDEKVIFTKSSSPFWDTTFNLPSFSEKRIFVTVDIASDTISGRTIKPKAVMGDIEIIGFEREILASAGLPTAPLAPIAGTPEVISDSVIRWHFEDRSDNEFGFKILDANLNELARVQQADISYIDETGLQPDTEYSGRKVVAFNDRGTSPITSLSIFPTVRTLALPEEEETEETEEIEKEVEEGVEEETIEEETIEEKPAEEPMTAESLRAKIKELQLQLIELLRQLIQILLKRLV